MAGTNGHMTPTHKRLLAVLSDGLSHTKEELKDCLWDEMADVETVKFHLSDLRRLLPKGQDIISKHRPDGGYGYIHVRIISIKDE